MVFLLLLLGVGISVLLTELSRGLTKPHSLLLIAGIFTGYVTSLLVGSQSSMNHVFFGWLYWPHPQALVVLYYILIISVGAFVGRSSVD